MAVTNNQATPPPRADGRRTQTTDDPDWSELLGPGDGDGLASSLGRFLVSSAELVGHVWGRVDRLVSDVQRDSRAVARESAALYAAAAGRVGSVRDAVRATPRFTRIVTSVLKIAATYRVHQSRAPYLSEERAAAALERLHQANAKRLHDLCVELGGAVLKVGQFVSCRMDLLPPAWVEALAELQDRVPAEPPEVIAAFVEAELGVPIDERFASFDPEPIAAASLAQVHLAVLPDGREVAVKVQRPGIDAIVEIDISALQVLADVLSGMLPTMDLGTIAGALSQSLAVELDFESEAKNIDDFADQFGLRQTGPDSPIRVPRVHHELSTSRLLVMDRLEGERITDFLDGCEARGEVGAKERDRLFEILIRCFTSQILEHGLFHADPHPGNFLVAPGPQLVLLDFGAVERFSPELRRAYAELAGAILSRNAAKMAELLGVMGFRARGGDGDGVVGFAELFMEVFTAEAAGKLADVDPQQMLVRSLELARNTPVVQVPQDFVMLGRVFAALGGLLFRYRPEIDLFRILGPALSAALVRKPQANAA